MRQRLASATRAARLTTDESRELRIESQLLICSRSRGIRPGDGESS